MPRSFRFLHAADLHLDSPLLGLRRRTGEGANPFLGASRRAFDTLVGLAIDREVAFVLIVGDLYDGDWRDWATGQFAVRQFSRLARAGIPVFLIRGNHDAESVISRGLPLPPNVTTLDVRRPQTVFLEDVSVAIHGQSFATRHVADNVALTYPQAVPGYLNVGMLHTSLTGRDGHGAYAPCAVADLARLGYDYFALGHVHAREVVSTRPYVVYPGNLQGRHSRETGDKGCTIVDVRDGAITGLEHVACDVCRFATVDVDVGGTAEPRVHARAPIAKALEDAEGRPLAIRVRLVGEPMRPATVDRALLEGLWAVATSLSQDAVIEKVVDATVAPAAVASPVPAFAEILDEVAADDEFREDLVATFRALREALPPEAVGLLDAPDVRLEEYVRSTVSRALIGLSVAGGVEA